MERSTHTWLFDFDGTLVDSMPTYASVMLRILDDNLNADHTAKAAGMRVCGVYDASSAEYEEQIRQVADRYIVDFQELL